MTLIKTRTRRETGKLSAAIALVILCAALVMQGGLASPRAVSAARASSTTDAGTTPADLRKSGRDDLGAVSEVYRNLPLSFEVNRGQAGGDVKYLSRGSGLQLLLAEGGATLALPGAARSNKSRPKARTDISRARADVRAGVSLLRMTIDGARVGAEVSGEGELTGKANYLLGADPNKWVTGVSTYSRVRYSGVYPGVDMVFYGDQRQLEYDFDLAPGADPAAIKVAFEGADRIGLDREGGLVLKTKAGQLTLRRPVAYQEADGVRREVASSYVILGKGRVGFRLGEYDRTRALVIDPVLVYSTYVGGSGRDVGTAVTVDSAGNAYVAGLTLSTNFPATTGALRVSLADYNGSPFFGDAFVTKLNSAGNGAVYSTYIGGLDSDIAKGIAVDAAGSAYVVGSTASNFDFPTTVGAFQTSPSGGQYDFGDAFVAKLTPDGAGLVYSTRLGGADLDNAYGVAVDNSGNAIVVGATDSTNFPTTAGAPQTAAGMETDAFLSKLNPTGTALVYSTYLGGSAGDIGNAVAADSSGNAYATGTTTSTDFPVTAGSLRTSSQGSVDTFVTKVSPTGALAYSTYLGGGGEDFGIGVAVDSSGNAYITGHTNSTNFPTTLGAYQTSGASFFTDDAFVSKLNPAGSALVYSTYLGTANAADTGNAIAVSPAGEAYVCGQTASSSFPVTGDATQSAFGGVSDAFVSTLDAAGASLVFSTYVGGNKQEVGRGVALDPSGNIYAVGSTQSSNFAVTPGSFQRSIGGGSTDTSAFVVKIGTAPAVSYSISGHINDGTNNAAGVGVHLSGSLEGWQFTDAAGNYSFGNLPPGGTYTVTPSSPFYDFGTQSRTFANLSANQTADFTGTLLHFSISGTILDTGGHPLQGVTLGINGTQLSAQTDAAGHYTFANLSAVGTYVVAPSKTDYFFTPFSRTLNNLPGNQTADFTGTLAFSISGRVVDSDGNPLAGLTVQLTGSDMTTTATGTSGNYSFTDLPVGGTYTVTPSNPDYNFAPASQSFQNLDGHKTADFTGTYKYGSIAGRVTDESGKAISNVSVTLTGSPQSLTTSTDSNGNYKVSLLPKGNTYTVKPSSRGYSFTPSGVTLTVSGDHGRVDFTRTPNMLRPFGVGNILVTPGIVGLAPGHLLGEYTQTGALVQEVIVPFPPGIPSNASLYMGELAVDKNGDVEIYTGPGSTSYLTGSDLAHGTWRFHTYPNWNPWTGYNADEGLATIGDYVFVTDKLQGDFGQPTQTQGLIRISLTDYTAQRFAQDITFTHLTAGRDGLIYAVVGGTAGSQINVYNPLTLALVKTINLQNGQNVHQISVNAAGEIYATEFAIDRFDNTGKLLNKYNTPDLIFDVEIADDGTVAMSTGGSVKILDASLNLVRSFNAPAGYIAFTNSPPPPASSFTFSAGSYAVSEGAGSATVTVNRSGDTSGPASVEYTTEGGTARETRDFTAAYGVLNFAPGETSKSFTVITTDNAFVDGSRTVILGLRRPSGAQLLSPGSAVLTIGDNDAAGAPNPVDDSTFFVRRHYADFLNREPDASGLAFWVNQIESCGASAQCREAKRIHVSAAFFLSIEFQETGYLIERIYKTAYGDATSPRVSGTVPVIRLREFLPDTQAIGRGLIVGQGDWQNQLEQNKNAFALEFVQRPRFTAAFPSTMTADEFVSKLDQNAGGVLSASDKASLVALLGATPADASKRAQALRSVAENADLRQRELNRAFVLMQYYGYMRRNPDDPQDTDFRGWRFWLSKLESFNGDFIKAEMVKAFISADEYRHRFGQ
jgi:hypothetical protein